MFTFVWVEQTVRGVVEARKRYTPHRPLDMGASTIRESIMDYFSGIRLSARPGREPNGRRQRPKCEPSAFAYVYIMEGTNDGSIKVGWSRNPAVRILSFSTDSRPVCRRWQAKCALDDAGRLEREFHKRRKMTVISLGREWYSITAFDAAEIIKRLAVEMGIKIECPEIWEGSHKDQIMEMRTIGSFRSRPVHMEDENMPSGDR